MNQTNINRSIAILATAIVIAALINSLPDLIYPDFNKQIASNNSIIIEEKSDGSVHVTKIYGHGITEERFEALAKELGVTQNALKNFFKELERKQVPFEDLHRELYKIAKEYRNLEEKVSKLTSNNLAIMILKDEAEKALEQANFEYVKMLLNKARKTKAKITAQTQSIAKKHPHLTEKTEETQIANNEDPKNNPSIYDNENTKSPGQTHTSYTSPYYPVGTEINYPVETETEKTLAEKPSSYYTLETETEKTLTEALKTAHSIENTLERTLTLSTIAIAQAETGNTPATQNTITQALNSTQGIENATDYAKILNNIATAQAKLGDIDKALKTAQDITDTPSRTNTLSEIAGIQAKTGDVVAAQSIINQALQTARSIENSIDRANALSKIAIAQNVSSHYKFHAPNTTGAPNAPVNLRM